jgi:hypothetical protein
MTLKETEEDEGTEGQTPPTPHSFLRGDCGQFRKDQEKKKRRKESVRSLDKPLTLSLQLQKQLKGTSKNNLQLLQSFSDGANSSISSKRTQLFCG